tara:strand:+ start:132 stop:1628 length:1497 start_codon:yes stop_codon:yes gene_type:complete
MLKLLIFLVLLVGSSLFVTNAFSLEVEFQNEGDWFIESMGWLTPEKFSLQEQFQIIIDESKNRNRISIGVLSTNPAEIIFTDKIEALSSNPMIHSFTLTNKFGCAPTQIDRACIIIEVKREGLGDVPHKIRQNALEITDKIVADGIMFFAPEFYSATVQPKTSFDGSEKTFVVEAVYTINKQPTELMFAAFAPTLLSSDVRDAGGFYNNAEKLSKHYFSEISVTFMPLENDVLRTFHILLTCSNELIELPNCDPDGNIDEQLARGNVNPLDFIQVENISRSKIFEDEFLPLNSVIQILIFSEENLQVKSVNSNVIEKLQNLGDVQENGWFFTSKSGKKIDGRYLFGQESSVSTNDLAFSIGAYSVDDVEIKEVEGGGGCLIATAAFGSEMAPQVQFLREIRDNTILQTESGSAFMIGFNQFYYSFSPIVADYERENPAFKETVKLTLTPLLTSLTLLQYADIDSEYEMLGYGISIMLLNIGMYFVAPAILIMKIKKRI